MAGEGDTGAVDAAAAAAAAATTGDAATATAAADAVIAAAAAATAAAQTTVATLDDKGGFNENWQNSLPEDIRNEPILKNFKGLEGLARTLVHQGKTQGHEKIAIPREDWSDSQYSEFYNKIGRPATIDDYKYDKVEGVNLPEGIIDEASEKSFKELAHKIGITGSQYADIRQWNEGELASKYREVKENIELDTSTAEIQLRKEWGKDYAYKSDLANRVVRTLGLSEMLKEMGLDNHPKMVKGMALVANSMSDSELVASNINTTGTEIQDQIDTLMADKRYQAGDQVMVDKVAALYEMKHARA